MIKSNFTINSTEKAEANFNNIKNAIKGLYEILKINLDSNDIYFQMSLDNLNGIYKNLLELLLNDYGARQFMKKLRNSEVELDIDLDGVLVNQQKQFLNNKS
ncbi:MAG: hypothetical protein ACTSQJ_13575 [Promethearchaeota archaeon]